MNRTGTATAKALNLQAITYFLTKETSPAFVADDLDEMIFDFMHLFGNTDGDLVSCTQASNHVYTLKRLRDLFIKLALDNNDVLKFERITEDYYFSGKCDE